MTQSINNNPFNPGQGLQEIDNVPTGSINTDNKVDGKTLNNLQTLDLGKEVQSLLSNVGPLLDAPLVTLAAIKSLVGADVPSLEALFEKLDNAERSLSIKESLKQIEAQAKVDAQQRAENIHNLKNLIIYLELPEEIDLESLAKQANAVCVALDKMLEAADPESAPWLNARNESRGLELGDEGYVMKEMYVNRHYMEDGYDGTIPLDDNPWDSYIHRYNIEKQKTYMYGEQINEAFAGTENGEINIDVAIAQIIDMYNMPKETAMLLSLMMDAGARASGEIALFTAGQDVTPDDIYQVLFKDSFEKLLPMAILKGDSALSDLEFASVVLDVDLNTLTQFEQTKNYMLIMAELAKKLASLNEHYHFDEMTDWQKEKYFETKNAVDGKSINDLHHSIILEAPTRGSWYHTHYHHFWGLSSREPVMLALKSELAEREAQIALIQTQVDTAKDLMNINLARALA